MADFGQWRPDLPPIDHDGLVTARNAYHSALGYRPIKGPSAVTTAVGSTWLGGGAFVGLDGSTALLAGCTGGLYAYSGSSWSSKYAASYTLPWQFAQFGDVVIGVAGAAPVKYTISTATGALLGGSPPVASMICIGGDHVFLAGNSSAVKTVYWSASNDSGGWTGGTNGAGTQVLPDGDAITGLAGGEYVLVFQSNATNIFEKAEAPLFWSRRKIADIGALCPGGVVKAGRDVAIYCRDGFKLISDLQYIPIGMDKVDRTFSEQYSEAEIISNLRSAYDEKRRLIIWSMPSRLWIYHIDTQSWTEAYVPDLVGISTAKTVNVTLETIEATYPTVESVPGSFDDPIWQGGSPMLTFAKSDNILYSFGAMTNLEATFQMTRQEVEKGRWVTVRAVRPVTDATSGLIASLDCYARLGDAPTVKQTSSLMSNGDMPILANGHYIQAQLRIAEGTTWRYATGLDLIATGGGRR